MPDTAAPVAQVVAPYITVWSTEQEPEYRLVERQGVGIGYLDELVTDRDTRGVLWSRAPLRHGVGRPLFGKVHPLRQRRVMRRLLCQVCAGPADRTEDGVLFLLQDHRQDWPGWPNRMGVSEPPVCLPCVRLSARMCPALRRGAVLVRAGRYDLTGIDGRLYAGGRVPRLVGRVTISVDNPAVRWVQATSLVRELHDCTLIELDEFAAVSPCRN